MKAALPLLLLLGACATNDRPCPPFPTLTTTLARSALPIAPNATRAGLAERAKATTDAMARARAEANSPAARLLAQAALADELPWLLKARDWDRIQTLIDSGRAQGLLNTTVSLALEPGILALPPGLLPVRNGLRNGRLLLFSRLDNNGRLPEAMGMAVGWEPNPLNADSSAGARATADSAAWILGFDAPTLPENTDAAPYREAVKAALACRADQNQQPAQLTRAMLQREGLLLPADAATARSTYAAMAATTGGTMYVYVPGVDGRPGYTMPVNTPVRPGNVAAQRELGLMLLAGEGGKTDREAGCESLLRAARSADLSAIRAARAAQCPAADTLPRLDPPNP
ncbi:SEL1-like repeat protein [Sandaracinobacteroides saxicola]|uniref:Uncharacterized protein n=1 Tax=Sandaracinobacteroides saxicola TaxID=2759707 RepID=A0A7G5IJ77_9SPHN|nr:hypothetical protein [Sandaracinobacteroides saxicola]QMW23419.1 hypothetical protein H3309_02640 [Sandaracinobacteroides saxicola]